MLATSDTVEGNQDIPVLLDRGMVPPKPRPQAQLVVGHEGRREVCSYSCLVKGEWMNGLSGATK